VSVGADVLYLEYLVGVLKKELILEDIMWDRQWSCEGWGERVDLVAPHMDFGFNGFEVYLSGKAQFMHQSVIYG